MAWNVLLLKADFFFNDDLGNIWHGYWDYDENLCFWSPKCCKNKIAELNIHVTITKLIN